MDAIFLYPAAAAQLVMERRMEAISNNIANADTTGFRRDIPVFGTKRPMLSKAYSIGGAEDPTGGKSILPIPYYPVVDEIVTDFSQGMLHHTDNPLDLAIDGKGFFQIQTNNGVKYTRNGSFRLSAEGQIVTQSGQPLMGEGGPITVPPGDIEVDNEGILSVKGLEGGPPIQIDTLTLVAVEDLSKMRKIGDNLFELVDGTPTILPQASVHQGSLERSNVDPVIEMVAMISAMRHYESVQKAIQGADDIALRNVNQIGQLKA
jgi:flagellar basal-body rod protein FlgG